MPRTLKNDKEPKGRAAYSYFAYPKTQRTELERIVREDAFRYGIENVNDLMKNVVGEIIAHYLQNHNYIESRKHAANHWQEAKFAQTEGKHKRRAETQKKVLLTIDKELSKDRELVAKLMADLDKPESDPIPA